MYTVIFDMDGLLVDTEELWRKHMIKEFSSIGIDLSYEDCAVTAGMRMFDVSKHWLDYYKLRIDSDFVANKIITGVINNIAEEVSLKEGVIDMLGKVKSKGWKIGLASGSDLVVINEVLLNMKIDLFFDVICSSEEVERGKPFPDVYQRALNIIDASPGEALAFEDSVNGLISAVKSGMKTIYIPNEKVAQQGMALSNATYSSMKDIGIDDLESIYRGS